MQKADFAAIAQEVYAFAQSEDKLAGPVKEALQVIDEALDTWGHRSNPVPTSTDAPASSVPPPVHPWGEPNEFHLRMFHEPLDVLNDDDEPSWTTLSSHLPGVMLAFAAHVALRRRYPRQLPPLTPLGVREIYAGIALAWAVENASSAYTVTPN
ncbi:hypothetical protein C8Q79DRAFT_928342 [Trametes meyenii]|nr:hypothetical protein C8Q79DRAFT_928342 [Trametes meyenii]